MPLLRPYQLREAIQDFGGDTSLSSALAQLETQKRGGTYPCPKCATNGVYPGFKDSGDPLDKDLVECTLCDGYGYTMTPKRVVVCGYEDVPDNDSTPPIG